MTAANFNTWWSFCMLPNHDGQASDGPDTRWGWTFDTWVTARTWEGYTDISRGTFNAMTEQQMGQLAQGFFWERQGGVLLPAGLDVSVIDWAWTSGGAVMDIQRNVGDVAVDGFVGPHTVAALVALGSTVLQDIHDWRVDYYQRIGLLTPIPGGYEGEDPGLGHRADDCLTLAQGLAI